MRNLFSILKEKLSAGQDVVLTAIVASSGSVPRGSGALMLVTDEGRAAGTIGGGISEFKAEQIAKEVLRDGLSRTHIYKLYHNEKEDIDSICGGDQEVYFRFIKGKDTRAIELCKKLEEMYESGEQCWLIEEITEKSDGLLTLYSPKRGDPEGMIPKDVIAALAASPKVVEAEGRRFYTMRIVSAGRVFIFGGGHVSQQLVPTLARCDFRCTVLEDRPEFAEPDLFEGVERARLVDMNDLAPVAEELSPDDFVCIMTRGHRNDYEVVYHMLKSKACYIGLIGSRSKVAALKEHLLADGFTEKDFERLTTPIGIEICSETPAEIAVSIAAQLIKVRAIRTGSRKVKHLNGE